MHNIRLYNDTQMRNWYVRFFLFSFFRKMIAANHFKARYENIGDVRAVKIQRTYAFRSQAWLDCFLSALTTQKVLQKYIVIINCQRQMEEKNWAKNHVSSSCFCVIFVFLLDGEPAFTQSQKRTCVITRVSGDSGMYTTHYFICFTEVTF